MNTRLEPKNNISDGLPPAGGRRGQDGTTKKIIRWGVPSRGEPTETTTLDLNTKHEPE